MKINSALMTSAASALVLSMILVGCGGTKTTTASASGPKKNVIFFLGDGMGMTKLA